MSSAALWLSWSSSSDLERGRGFAVRQACLHGVDELGDSSRFHSDVLLERSQAVPADAVRVPLQLELVHAGLALDEVKAGPRFFAPRTVDGDRHRGSLGERRDHGAEPIEVELVE